MLRLLRQIPISPAPQTAPVHALAAGWSVFLSVEVTIGARGGEMMATYKTGDRVQLRTTLSVQKAGRVMQHYEKGTIRAVTRATYTVEFDDARPLIPGLRDSDLQPAPLERIQDE
jgi:hypothetical protein